MEGIFRGAWLLMLAIGSPIGEGSENTEKGPDAASAPAPAQPKDGVSSQHESEEIKER